MESEIELSLAYRLGTDLKVRSPWFKLRFHIKLRVQERDGSK